MPSVPSPRPGVGQISCQVGGPVSGDSFQADPLPDNRDASMPPKCLASDLLSLSWLA